MSKKDKDNVHDKRQEAIKLAVEQIIKNYGQGAILSLSDEAQQVKVISTGSLTLDLALGVGGVPVGRITEIYGGEGSGKTTICLNIVKNAQDSGGMCAYIDAEHALDISYAKKLGVRTNDLLISQPENGEQALEIVDMLVRSSAVDVIIVDSVAALVPKQELEGQMGDAVMGAQARLMSQALRKITGSISRSNTSVIFINQTRSKIGIMFGNPETTTGGNALKFYASVRIELRRKSSIKKGDENVGHIVGAKVVKNRLASPYREAEIELRYGHGVYFESELVEVAVKLGLLQKSGPWYSYKDKKIAQGKDATISYLNDNPDVKKEILKLVKENSKKKIDDITPFNKSEEAEEATG